MNAEDNNLLAENHGGTYVAVAPAVFHAPMTIGAAVDRYKAEREAFPSPALREVVNYMIDHNIKTEFNNDSYQDALALTDVMFTRSTKTIRMLTGTHGDGFLNALLEPFVAALERIRLNRGFVKIIVIGQTCKTLTELQSTFAGTLKVIRAQASGPIKHFTVCDSNMARMEEIHEPLTSDTLITAIKAKVCFNDRAQSGALEENFDKIWNRLEQILSNSAVDKK